MSRFVTALALGLLLFPSLGESSGKKLLFCKDGEAQFLIVIGKGCSLSERHAALELQHFLGEVTGGDFPIIMDGVLPARQAICVGESRVTKELGVELPLSELGDEGFVIQIAGEHLVIAGSKLRGTLYGCYQFLEEDVGCRWFTPDASRIPKRPTLKIKVKNRRYSPPLEYRATDYPHSRNGDWSARNRMNGHLHSADETRGGHVTYHHFVHTFHALLPSDQYFADHPEYFSFIEGKRAKDKTQLCLTNPEVGALGIRKVEAWIREKPSADIYSVSQNDWWNYCQCESCERLAKSEGGQSGPLLCFVNKIAEAVEKDYPDKAISTLAYQYTRKPPKTLVPRDNVIVRLCSIECCFAHPLATDPFNQSFKEDIQRWNEISDRLYIWDYVINYAHSIMPFPNLYVLRPNIQFFVENGVKGIYEEANYYSKGGELAELRTYILAKTLWDPSTPTDQAIDEFLEGYYGGAARPLKRYIRLIHKQVKKNDKIHMGIYSSPDIGYYTDAVLRKATKLFQEAEDAVSQDETLLQRVKVTKMPLLYTKIALAGDEMERTEDSIQVKGDIGALIQEFEETAKQEGVSRVREGGEGALDTWLSRIKSKGWEHPISRLENEALSVEILPTFGGRLISLRDRRTGREWLKTPCSEDGCDPGIGGYEETTGPGFRSPGWNEAYKLIVQKADTLTLKAALRNGLTCTRTVALSGKGKALTIETKVKNETQEPREALLAVRPQFAVERFKNISLQAKKGDTWRDLDLASWYSGQLEDQKILANEEKPNGSWRLLMEGTEDVLEDTFNPESVSRCVCQWSVPDKRVELMLYSERKTLGPGETLSLAHSYRIIEKAKKASLEASEKIDESE